MGKELLLAARERQLGGEAVSGKEDLFGFFFGLSQGNSSWRSGRAEDKKEKKRRVWGALLWDFFFLSGNQKGGEKGGSRGRHGNEKEGILVEEKEKERRETR